MFHDGGVGCIIDSTPSLLPHPTHPYSSFENIDIRTDSNEITIKLDTIYLPPNQNKPEIFEYFFRSMFDHLGHTVLFYFFYLPVFHLPVATAGHPDTIALIESFGDLSLNIL